MQAGVRYRKEIPRRFIPVWYLFFHMKNACSRAGSVVAVLQGKMPRPAIGGVALSPSRRHISEREGGDMVLVDLA